MTPLKIFPFALPALFVAACATSEPAATPVPTAPELEAATEDYVFRALVVDESAPGALEALRNMKMRSVNIVNDAELGPVLAQLGEIYQFNAGAGPALKPRFADAASEAALRDKIVTMRRGRMTSFAEIYDHLCAQAGAVWWVGDGVFVQKTPEAKR